MLAMPSPAWPLLTGLLAAGLAAGSGCVEAPPIIESTTALESTPDTVGPYVVHTVVSGVTDQAVELRYRLDDDLRYIPLRMLTAPGSSPGEHYTAAIPGRPAGTIIAYYVTVLQDDTRIADDPVGAGAQPYTFAIAAE